MTYSNYRIVLAIAAAAIIACFFTIITATADRVEASARIANGGPFGAQCSQRAWPYYEPHCLQDLRPRGARMLYRIVTTERE